MRRDGVEEWKECKLGDYCDFQNGYAFKSSEFKTNGEYKIVKIKELKDGLVKFFDDSASVDIHDIKEFEKYKIYRNDVLFALTGDPVSKPNPLSWVGRVSIYRSDENALLNQRTCKIKKSDEIDNQFLYYYFRQWENFYALASKATGSASQANISTNTIADTIIKLPPLPTQQKIAAILASLDDKIELNNKINTNLEQQARALFKNWFVDCMNSTTKMSDIIDVRDGTYDSPKPQESGYLLVTSKHLEAYSINPTDANFITKEDYDKINERSKVDNGDILLSMIGTVGIVSLVIDNPVTWAIKNMGLFKTSKVEDLKYYLLNYLKSDDVRNYIEQHLAGSTQKYISLSELRNLPINIPEKNILEKFNNIVTPIYEQIVNNTNEIKNLKELRDTLLPKLMNGEIFDN